MPPPAFHGRFNSPAAGLPKIWTLTKLPSSAPLTGMRGLDEERVGVFEVEMHESHHGNSHQLRLVLRLELAVVILLNGRSDQLGFFSRTHGRWLNIFECRQIYIHQHAVQHVCLRYSPRFCLIFMPM